MLYDLVGGQLLTLEKCSGRLRMLIGCLGEDQNIAGIIWKITSILHFP